MKLFPIIGLLTVVSGLASANDGWYIGIGGAARSMRKHPSVRMVQETVHLNPWTGKVRAVFIFQNEGKATTVTMGFPESGGKEISVLKGRSGFSKFASYVDGEKAKVKRQVGSAPDAIGYRIWWTKSVEFGENQRRNVVVEYETEAGYDTGGEGWFDYVVGTGATWKGKIGSAKFVMDLSGLHPFQIEEIYPKPTFRNGSTAEWHFTNFEPKRDMQVGVRFFYGFLNVFVNGKRIADRVKVEGGTRDSWYGGDEGQTTPSTYTVPSSWGPPPKRSGSDVMASPRAVAYWLGGTSEFDKKSAAVTIRLDAGRWARVKPRDRRMWTNRGVVPLRRAPILDRGLTRVPMAAIARGLGGMSKWRNGKLYLQLPRI